MAKKQKIQATDTDSVFIAFEKAVPKGATTIHVLEAAMMLIGNSLAQMEATPRQRRDTLHFLEDYMLRRIEGFKDKDIKKN
ncbi:MAG: hypothetical protein IKQ37_03990 [Bacteroidaceae bacterium]|nr:hypothetical protein [Bacteroidaceae bacterium]